MTPSPEALLALGPLLLFAMAFTETSVPAGLLVPAGVSLALAAVLAHGGYLEWPPVLLAAGVGALAGDSTGYWLGRSGSRRFQSLPGFAGRVVGGSQRAASRLFRGPPFLSVSVARMASFVRTLMPAAAGMSGLTYPRFLVYDVLGVGLWLVLYVGIGILAGESWRVASGLLGTGWAVVLLLALLWSGWAARRRGLRESGTRGGAG
jgi:membrane-associated protein